MQSPCWLVQLLGPPDELEDLPRWFPDGPVFARLEDTDFYLSGPAFEHCDGQEQVRDLAEAELDLLTASAKLLFGGLQRPRIAAIYRIDEHGNRHAFAQSAFADLQIGYKVRGADGCDTRPTPPQRQVHAARNSHHLRLAMQLWADETRTWPRLYRILEEIEQSFQGKPVDRVGLCSANERERFARSANSPKVSGLDARHADKGHVPPTNPMTLMQANQFVRQLLVRALEHSAHARGDA